MAVKKKPRSPTPIIPPAGGVDLRKILGAAMETPPPQETVEKRGTKKRKAKKRKG